MNGVPTWLVWVPLVLAVLPLVMTLRNRTRFVDPRQWPPAGTRVSILIPARDEASQIETAIRCALGSTLVEVEVVVLDDQSSDDTAALVSAMAATDPRVRLVSAPPLPRGWAGKQRACWLLGNAASFDVMMFVDADVRLAPTAAGYAAGQLLRDERLGLVSGFPRELTVGAAEQVLIPWIHVVLLGYLPFDRMQRSASPSYSAACGQWVVVRRRPYLELGGHGATPASRHDGISLPRTFRTAGWRTDVFDGATLAQCRMYPDFGSIWQGFGKSAGEGMATPLALPLWAVLLLGGHVAPWLMLPLGLAWQAPVVAMAGGLGVAANLVMRYAIAARLGHSHLSVWLHPVGALLTVAINASSLAAWLAGRPRTWRGRAYALGAPGASAQATSGVARGASTTVADGAGVTPD